MNPAYFFFPGLGFFTCKAKARNKIKCFQRSEDLRLGVDSGNGICARVCKCLCVSMQVLRCGTVGMLRDGVPKNNLAYVALKNYSVL